MAFHRTNINIVIPINGEHCRYLNRPPEPFLSWLSSSPRQGAGEGPEKRLDPLRTQVIREVNPPFLSLPLSWGSPFTHPKPSPTTLTLSSSPYQSSIRFNRVLTLNRLPSHSPSVPSGSSTHLWSIDISEALVISQSTAAAALPPCCGPHISRRPGFRPKLNSNAPHKRYKRDNGDRICGIHAISWLACQYQHAAHASTRRLR